MHIMSYYAPYVKVTASPSGDKIEALVNSEIDMKAIWKDTVIAESDETLEIEGDVYFPQSTIKKQYINASKSHMPCPWRGEANCWSIEISGDILTDAAWYYPAPDEKAIAKVGTDFTGYVAFGKGVEITK